MKMGNGTFPVKRLVSIVLVLMFVMTACGQNSGGNQAQPTEAQTTTAAVATTVTAAATTTTASEAEKKASADGPYGKFDPPITITTIRNISDREYMPGETWDNNIWTQAYEEILGITFDYIWTAQTDFNTRLNTAIATDDIPDFMNIPYDQFAILATGNRLAPLDDALKEYGIHNLHDGLDAHGGIMRAQVTFNGNVMGIGNPPSLEPPQLWYRDDWAAAVGRGKPETFEDVLAMAVDFATKDPNGTGTATVGIGVSKDLFGGGMGLESLFSAYGAYPQLWVEENGELIFGFMQEDKIKEPLRVLQDLFRQKAIDPDFMNIGTWDMAPDDIVKEKIGMVLGPIWFGDWKLSALMEARGDDTATWTCMVIPSLAGGPVNLQPVRGKLNQVVCANAKMKYPEAVVKLLNLGTALIRGDLAEGKYHNQPNPNEPDRVVNNFFHNLTTDTGGDGTSWNYICALAVTKALETGDTSELNDEQMSYYERSKGWMDRTNLSGYTSFSIFGPGGSQYVGEEIRQKSLYYMEPYYGPSTETMNENIGNINSKRNEIITNIILGGDVDAGFQEFVNYWNANYGDVITKEVNEWYQNEKSK